jgi:hypothetical protein
MKVDREIEVPLDKIVKDWDVRVEAGFEDPQRVDLLQGLYNDGKTIDLIKVATVLPELAEKLHLLDGGKGFYRLIEGRTRFAALKKNGTKKITVAVLAPATEPEYLTYAYKCNCEGPKPPKFEDLKQTIELLIKSGMKEKAILNSSLNQVESMKRLKEACDQVRSNLNKQGVREAQKILLRNLEPVRTITDQDKRLKAAASACGITVQALKKAVNREPGRKKQRLIFELKKDLGGLHNRRSQFVRDWTGKLNGHYDDGYPTDQILEIFDHIIKQLSQNVDTMVEARDRFEIRANSGVVKTKVKTAAVAA